MKALGAIGWARAARYVLWSVAYHLIFRFLSVSPLRVLVLRALGARLGPHAVVMDVRFTNLDRGGVKHLRAGRDVFIGDEVMLDMAGPIVLGDQVTLAERVSVLTHINVGYADHPLQRDFSSAVLAVAIGDGCYVGAGAILLPGVTIGARSAVGAGAVVTGDVEAGVVAVGIPARVMRRLDATKAPLGPTR